jgi:hypothetical protein
MFKMGRWKHARQSIDPTRRTQRKKSFVLKVGKIVGVAKYSPKNRTNKYSQKKVKYFDT